VLRLAANRNRSNKLVAYVVGAFIEKPEMVVGVCSPLLLNEDVVAVWIEKK